MATERIQRRLAAILAADVVGYSRLMATDEVATLAALKAYRKELIDPKIVEHGDHARYGAAGSGCRGSSRRRTPDGLSTLYQGQSGHQQAGPNMLTIHHLGISQSERIVWLCEEVGIDYELKRYERRAVRPFRGGCGDQHRKADRGWIRFCDPESHRVTGLYVPDLHDDDIFWCTADPGWVTGTSYGIIAPLTHGVTRPVLFIPNSV
jgi:hypothetical protein